MFGSPIIFHIGLGGRAAFAAFAAFAPGFAESEEVCKIEYKH
jgi:hypothetical protein